MYPLFELRTSKNTLIGKGIRTLILITVGLVVGSLIVALFPPLFRYKDWILELSFKLNMILIAQVIIGIVYYVFFRNKTQRKPFGQMTIEENHLLINEQTFPFGEIEKVRIVGNDIKGEFRGLIGYGQENIIFITLKNGQELSYNFQQTTKQRLKDDPHLEQLFKNQLLSKSNYESILHNTNYY